tara:strand:- start:14 stop:334 length:321 start_codon:yes stop_codon:yes gene_type:complete
MKELNDTLMNDMEEVAESINIAPTWEDLLVIMLQMYADTSYEGQVEFKNNIQLVGQVMDRLSGLINAMQPVIEIAQKSDLNEEDAKKIGKLDKQIYKIIELVGRNK